MNRRGFLKKTVGAVTAAVLFKTTLEAGTSTLIVDKPIFQPGDIFHVPRTKENFVISCVDGGKVTFSSPIRSTVRPDDEVILIGNCGVQDNTAQSGWLEEELWPRYFKGKDLKR